VGTILKNRSEQVRVAFSDYYGEPRVDLRIYFLDGNDQWQPTKKGLSLPLPAFRQLQPRLDKLSRRLADDHL